VSNLQEVHDETKGCAAWQLKPASSTEKFHGIDPDYRWRDVSGPAALLAWRPMQGGSNNLESCHLLKRMQDSIC